MKDVMVSSPSSNNVITLGTNKPIIPPSIPYHPSSKTRQEYRKKRRVNAQLAVERLVSWAGIVINGMQEIQWKNLGYAMGPTGIPDPTRPLFNIPDPSQVIAQIIQQ